jgi:DNA-binding MarR family transcriptional regulator
MEPYYAKRATHMFTSIPSVSLSSALNGIEEVPHDIGEHRGNAMSTDFKPTLTEEERKAMRALYLALKEFTALRPTMPLQYVMTFLLVATEEGKGVVEYSKMNDVSPTVMTRHLLDIGDRNREREAGFGLVTQERDVHDLRRHHARITTKGKALAHRIMQALKMAPK